jgi:hypothetical protein
MSPIVFFACVFPCTLAVTLWMGRRLSGWARLEREYRFTGTFAGTLHRRRPLTINTVYFRTYSSIGTDEHGLYIRLHFPFSLFHAPIRIPTARLRGVTRSAVPLSDAASVQVLGAEDIQIVVTLADAELIANTLLDGRYLTAEATPGASTATDAQAYFRYHAKKKAIMGVVGFGIFCILFVIVSYPNLRILADEAVTQGEIDDYRPVKADRPDGFQLVTYSFTDRELQQREGTCQLSLNDLDDVGFHPRISYCASDPDNSILQAYRQRRIMYPFLVFGLGFLGFGVFHALRYRNSPKPADPHPTPSPTA